MVTAGIGAVSFWLSPLREIVAHRIWREKAAVLLTTDSSRVVEGSPVQLRITVTPLSAIHVDKGLVTVGFDSRLLRLRAGQTTFASPVIESPVVLPDGSAIEFLAIAPGTAEIQV